MPGRLGITIVCLHISAALYVLLGIGFALFIGFFTSSEYMMSDPSATAGTQFAAVFVGVVIFALFLLLAVGVEVVVWGLKKLRYWAWIVGIVVCALYITSAFVILGGLGLWGLLDSDTQAAFRAARGQ